MKAFIGPRATGKTKELIKTACEKGDTIVCKNILHMVEKIHAYGYSNIQVITYDEFINNRNQYKHVYIDELEEFLKVLDVDGFTLVVGE